ncbi:MAG: hypothetical protein LRZ98_00550, partial [Candidatus Pacebacteria bacterium]|nr:hypothetical protein [Candidatus Paceibacterota bacterium]
GENGGSTDEGQPVTIPEVSGGDGGSTTDLTTTTAYQEAHIINCIETINNIENNCNQSEASVAGGN